MQLDLMFFKTAHSVHWMTTFGGEEGFSFDHVD